MTILQKRSKCPKTTVARKIFIETEDFDNNLSELADEEVSVQDAFQAIDDGFYPTYPNVELNTAHRQIVAGNPHNVTKYEIGLNNVPNLDTTAAIANEHTHSNKSQLDLITDGDHDVRTDNPHSVTKAQVGLSDVPNTDFTSAVAANTSDIATNTANIATNTSDIADNVADIATVDGKFTKPFFYGYLTTSATSGYKPFGQNNAYQFDLQSSNTRIRYTGSEPIWVYVSMFQLCQYTSGLFYFEIRKNNSTVRYGYFSSGDGYTRKDMHVSAIVRLNQYDYIQHYKSASITRAWQYPHSSVCVFKISD